MYNIANNYDWSNLKYCLDKTGEKFTKNTKKRFLFGNDDGMRELELSDDVAHVNWGPGWRMPSMTQIEELRTHCNWTWTTMGGHDGYKVTSKQNGNSIFLPAAGYRSEGSLLNASLAGGCWSRTLDLDDQWGAYGLYFNSSGSDKYGSGRRYGRSVRPVLFP